MLSTDKFQMMSTNTIIMTPGESSSAADAANTNITHNVKLDKIVGDCLKNIPNQWVTRNYTEERRKIQVS